MNRIALADWPINQDKPLLLYPEKLVNSDQTKAFELIGER